MYSENIDVEFDQPFALHVYSALSLHHLLYSWDLISFKFKVFVSPMKTAEHVSNCASAQPDKCIVHGA